MGIDIMTHDSILREAQSAAFFSLQPVWCSWSDLVGSDHGVDSAETNGEGLRRAWGTLKFSDQFCCPQPPVKWEWYETYLHYKILIRYL